MRNITRRASLAALLGVLVAAPGGIAQSRPTAPSLQVRMFEGPN